MVKTHLGFKKRLNDIYVPDSFGQPKVPDGWRAAEQNFAVTLAPGKPDNALTWKDVKGHPVQKVGSTWRIIQKAQPTQPTQRDQSAKPAEPAKPAELDMLADPYKTGSIQSLAKKARDDLDKRGASDDYKNLSDEEVGAARLYTAGGYEDINGILRGRGKHKPEHTAYFKAVADHTVEAVKKIPPSPGTFYRGAQGNIGQSRTIDYVRSLKPGDVYQDKGFGSHSANIGDAAEFSFSDEGSSSLTESVIFRISSKKGLHSVGPLSNSPDENEFLALPGAKFKVVSNGLVDTESLGLDDSAAEKMRLVELQHI